MKLSNFAPDYGLFDNYRLAAVMDALRYGVSTSAKKHRVSTTSVRRWMKRISVKEILDFAADQK